MKQIRHDLILKILEEKRKVTIEELQDTLKISIETIRRDLNHLEKAGFLKRVYGGAIFASALGIEPEYAKRVTSNIAEKKAIAIKTAQLINDGDTIALDLGTTTLEVAKQLTTKNNLIVFTNSLIIAQVLATVPAHKVFLCGGVVRNGENTTSGSMCLQGLERFRVDKAIIGVGGITVKHGITDFHEEEAEVRRKMIEIASSVIAVTDYSKFGVIAFCSICPLDSLDILITDWKAPRSIMSAIREKYPLQVLTAEKL